MKHQTEARGKFASKAGVVLATAGSAVGLGNIWRFPYETGMNGGAAFILIYLLCLIALGLPAMLCEFVVGRRAQRNATRAYGGWPWKLTGCLGVLTGFLIMGFYSVVAGWTLQYIFASVAGQLHGDVDYIRQYFNDFVANPWKSVFWTVFFILLTHVIITRGVQRGIERASKVMMPLLFLLLLLLVVCALLLPGSSEGVKFLLRPDFSKVSADTVFDALGQTFFSLSTGMACLVTYASYFDRDVHLVRSGVQIAVIDTMVAVLAGLIIFPAAFAVGVQPDAGPSLIFITLPNVFGQAFAAVPVVGWLMSIIFYILLMLAALTSIISMHETPTAFVAEEFHLSRRIAALLVTLPAMVVGVLSSLSLGSVPSLRLFGMTLFDSLDYITANVLLTLGGLLTLLYVGWVMPRGDVHEQISNGGRLRARYFPVFMFLVRYISPICMALIFLHQLGAF